MSKDSQESVWLQRIHTSNQRYEEWANKYQCANLEKYFQGFQWETSRYQTNGYLPYTLNLIYSTVKIKLANYLVRNPKVLVVPKPGDAAFNLEAAILSAQVKEAVANTLVTETDSNFAFTMKKAAKDSFFRFGLVEVGYSANFIENPYIDKPEYKSDKDPDVTNDGVATEPRETIESERVYFKHISPKRFRVGNIEGDTLATCNWFGYYEYIYVKDLAKALKKDLESFKNEIGTSAHTDVSEDSEDRLNSTEDMVKVWHIWDNRSRQRYLITDADGEIRFSKPFERIPLFDLRWDLDFEGWYPIPPVFQWKSPQDEINEAREQARNHRRRFTRKYGKLTDSLSAEEEDKFTNGPDGTVVEIKRADGLFPIANPDLGKASDQGLVLPKDDFNLVSSTSQEARGMGDRVTATQANIIENRANIREGAEVEEVNSWMAAVVRESLLIARDRFTQPLYTEAGQDVQTQMLMDYRMNKQYSKVYPDQLDDGYDFTVLIDVASTSPTQNEMEKQKFLEFLALMQNFPQLAMSPILIREAAYRVGYRNERVIREMQQAALLNMIGMAQQAGMQLPAGGNAGQQITEQQTPPNMAEIENQMGNQLVQ